MFDKQFIDDVTQKFTAMLPEGVQQLKQDMEKNMRAALQSAFAKWDLVTREEFDVQTKVLEKTRAKLEELEKVLIELEERVNARNKSSKK